MIKAEELRLNNFVIFNSEIKKIVTVNLNYVDFGPNLWAYASNIEPILLTKDILSNCKIKFNKLGFKDLTVTQSLINNCFYFVIGNYYHQIIYLHKLQNLYWCLCGTELEVNL